MKYRRLVILLLVWSWSATAPALAGDCDSLVLETRRPAYHIYPDHYTTCPDGVEIRCYHYHWDWVCEKGDKLYWDRRLEAAAHAACGCPMPPGVVPAWPHVSDRPREDVFGSGQ